MARLKNAIRGHFVADYTIGDNTPPTAWLELAKFITDITDDSEENVEDEGFYDGDGTPESTVTSIAGAFSIEGSYDPTDPAQKLIADKKYEVGEGRKLWHRIVSADGTTEWIGRATALDIIAGSGNATEYEAFSCTLRYDTIPDITTIP